MLTNLGDFLNALPNPEWARLWVCFVGQGDPSMRWCAISNTPGWHPLSECIIGMDVRDWPFCRPVLETWYRSYVVSFLNVSDQMQAARMNAVGPIVVACQDRGDGFLPGITGSIWFENEADAVYYSMSLKKMQERG